MKDIFKKDISYIFILPIIIIYLEIILKAAVYKTIFNIGFLNMVLFSVPIGLGLYLLSTLFKKEINKIIFGIFIFILTFIYGAQLVYYRVFTTFLSLYSFVGAGQAMQFLNEVIRIIYKNITYICLLLAPLVMYFIWNKKTNIKKINNSLKFKILSAIVSIQILIVCLVNFSTKGDLSSSYLYSQSFIIDMSVSRFGLLTTMRLDLKNLINSNMNFSNKSKNYGRNNEDKELNKKQIISPIISESSIKDSKEKKDEIVKIEYNILNIDFNELIENEDNKVIKDIHGYINSIEPTKKNEYTGKYKGKNLILITAEGFSPYAVRKDITPTLYKMYQEGFKFTNFYTAIWGVSTSDGEYVACTGLIPKPGIWSLLRSSENYMPFCMGNQLRKIGYETFAYHNHYYTFYRRDLSHPNMGYNYKGLGNGLDVHETWPESDLEMIDLTVDEYIDKVPFHTYYMTVSGHLQYNFGGNAMSLKNKEYVEHLEYSQSIKAYLACNIELDKAMESLIKKLEEKGIADDTLIAISPDHYPYGLEINEISELAGRDIEKNFELYKSVFILWSEGIKPVTIDKPCSSLDIIPTISNLLGLEYDSRLLMGTDILSDAESIVLFPNRSFVTENATYNSVNGEFKQQNKKDVGDEYKRQMAEKISEKFKYSALILDNDYYRTLIK